MASAWGMMVDTTASDGCDNYHRMSENKYILNTCLNNFIKMVNFL
jgi:hypothetical protein